MSSKKQLVARIDNQLVMKAHYNLAATEQKLILFLVAMIDKDRDDFNVQKVKITDIRKHFVADKRWGSVYERVNELCRSISSKSITIPKGFVVDSKPVRMDRFIPWFTDIDPHTDDDGDIAIKFQFAEPLKPFLLRLNEYVRVGLSDVALLNGKHTIRMYQIFIAERNRTKKHRQTSHITYGLDELRAILGIVGKYPATQDFKRRVLNPMRDEINEYSGEINLDYELLKTRRKITGVEFLITDSGKKEQQKKSPQLDDFKPTSEDVDNLPHAQRKAYQQLTEFGVIPGIAYRQILPRIKGEIFNGYEDHFVELAIEHFSKKSKSKNKAGAFVKWWCEVESFDSLKGKDWGKIADATTQRKRKLKTTNPEAYDNRETAKTMSYNDFVKWHKQQNQEEGETPQG